MAKIPLKVPTKALNAMLAKRKAAKKVEPVFVQVPKEELPKKKRILIAPRIDAANPAPMRKKGRVEELEATAAVPSQPAAVAEEPSPALPPEGPAEEAPKARKPRFKARTKPYKCPGGCENTGVVNEQPCPSCHPSEYVAGERAKRGACLHQEVGYCPACDRRAMEREGARGSAKDAPHDTFAVFRDYNGIVYLRVGLATKKKKADLYVVNKCFSVELVSICADSAASLYLQPVAGASVYEIARRLFTPLNDQATISVGAREYLTDILNNKELEMKATPKTAAATEVSTAKNAAPAKRAKFATTDPLPAAKGKKAATEDTVPAKAAKAAKETPAKATKAVAAKADGAAKAGRKVADLKITVLEKKNPYREGTKCYVTYDLLKTCKTTGQFREALNAAPKGTYDMSFPGWAAQPHGKQPAYVKLG